MIGAGGLGRQQQEDKIDRLLVQYGTGDRTVVAMKSAGAATVEFYNERSDQWIAPIRPASLAYLDHAMRAVESMRRDAAPKKTEPQP